jgi:hypothetical protein
LGPHVSHTHSHIHNTSTISLFLPSFPFFGKQRIEKGEKAKELKNNGEGEEEEGHHHAHPLPEDNANELLHLPHTLDVLESSKKTSISTSFILKPWSKLEADLPLQGMGGSIYIV